MHADERALLDTTVREALISAAAAGAAAVDTALAELGWLEMLEAEPRDALSVVFGALGAVHGSASVLDDVVAHALGTQPRPNLAVLLPSFGAWSPPATVENGRVSALGLTTARAITADELLIVGTSGAACWLFSVPRSTADVRAVRGVDPDAGLQLVRVEFDDAATTALDPLVWETAVALGQRAVAHQILGACRAMLDLARTHALARVQFDRPIARFQAVRHRLADALVAIEALESALTAAADEPGPLTAALTKALAGRTARTVGTHCQQVLAGVGFTTDHPFHRFLKRTMMLEGVFGSADNLALDLGRHVLATRRVPTLIEL